MDKIQIIELVLGKYRDNPDKRALESGLIPRFKTSDGKMCAIGTVLKKLDEYEDVMGGIFAGFKRFFQLNPSFDRSIIYPPKTFLFPIFDGHHIKFWKDLQDFHDNNNFYTQTGLSIKGLIQFEFLINKWRPQKAVVR